MNKCDIYREFFKALTKPFTNHPSTIGETYWQHFAFAVWNGICLLVTGVVLILHGMFPFLWPTMASDDIKTINEKFEKRRNHE